MTCLEQLTTPAALVHVGRMQRNIDRMQSRVRELGVKFRPHVKTTACHGSGLSQARFETFMCAQIAAMESSGLEPDAWVESFAAAFRDEWEAANPVLH